MAGKVKLIGDTTSGGTQSGATNRLWIIKFAADHSGTVTQMKVYTVNPGTGNFVSVAIYSDVDGSPTSLLSHVDDVPLVWENTIEIPQINISAGMSYWLAAVRSSGDLSYESGGTSRYANITYSSFEFPDPMGGLEFFDRTRKFRLSGWGTLATGGTGRLIGGPGKHPLISGPGKHPLISCGGNPLIG